MGNRKLSRILMAVALAMVLTVAVYAYLSANSGSVNNTFTPDQAVDPEVLSVDLSSTNIRVDVGNPGYSVYVRATIVATWEKKQGDDTLVYAMKPVLGTDYTLTLGTTGWFFHDGSYYHEDPVMYDGANPESRKTEILIQSCAQIGEPPEAGYELHVKIMAQTIQALGTTDIGNIPAVTDAWGIAVDSNTNKLTKPDP